MAFSTRRTLPYRLNLVELTFLPKSDQTVEDSNKTVFDSDFKQPVRTKKRKDPVKIKGQINFGRNQKNLFDRLRQSYSTGWNTTGDITDILGHCTFRKKEIDESGYMPEKGDLFVGYGDYKPSHGIEFLVEEIRPESPLDGHPLLFYVELRQNRNKR